MQCSHPTNPSLQSNAIAPAGVSISRPRYTAHRNLPLRRPYRHRHRPGQCRRAAVHAKSGTERPTAEGDGGDAQRIRYSVLVRLAGQTVTGG